MRVFQDILLILTINCERSSRLIGEAHDRPLTRAERFACGFHRVYCRWCRRYRVQLAVIQAAVTRRRVVPELSSDGRERIASALRRVGR